MILGGKLDTARLYVRPFVEDDTPRLVAIFADPLVARFVDDGDPLAEDMAALWIVRSRANLAAFGYGTGAVVERASGAMIGWAGIARPEDQPEEIIYGLARAHWRRGYGTELVAALVDFAEMRGIDPIRATVHTDNEGSIKLLRRAGFVLAETQYRGDPKSDLYLRHKIRDEAGQ